MQSLNVSKLAFVYRGNTRGGTKRVIAKLLEAYDKDINNKWVLITDKEECIGKYKNIKVKYFKRVKGIIGYFIWDYIKSFIFLFKSKFHGILYSKGSIPVNHLIIRSKKVYIVYDLGYFIKDLNAYPRIDTFFMKFQLRFSCRVADTIISISKFTKKDVIYRFGVKSEKIKVVYLGVDEPFKKVTNKEVKEECIKRNNINKPFLFYSGSISPRKNLLRVLKAYNAIKDKIPHSLVMTGRLSWGNTGIYKYIKENNIEERINILGFVSDKDLVTLYSTADLYLFLSLYEGFGLTILEAQACGCPVICSNVCSLPEVGGKGVHYIDPYNVKSIENGMLKILKEDIYRNDLIKRGFINKKRFSWKKSTNNLFKLINSL